MRALKDGESQFDPDLRFPIFNALVEFNVREVGPAKREPLAILLRNSNGDALSAGYGQVPFMTGRSLISSMFPPDLERAGSVPRLRESPKMLQRVEGVSASDSIPSIFKSQVSTKNLVIKPSEDWLTVREVMN